MKAYIFKSNRARRLMVDAGIPLSTAKLLQGKTLKVQETLDNGKCLCDFTNVDYPYYGSWHIPLDALNLIEEEQKIEQEYLYFQDLNGLPALRRYKKGNTVGEISMHKPAHEWTLTIIDLDTAKRLAERRIHYKQITEEEARAIFPDSFTEKEH